MRAIALLIVSIGAGPALAAAQQRRAPLMPTTTLASPAATPLPAVPAPTLVSLPGLSPGVLAASALPEAAAISLAAEPELPPAALPAALLPAAEAAASLAPQSDNAEVKARLDEIYEGKGPKPSLGWRLEGFHRVLDRLGQSGKLTAHDAAVLRRSVPALAGQDSYAKAFSAVLALDAAPEAVTGLPKGEIISDAKRVLAREIVDETSELGSLQAETRTLSRTARYSAPDGAQQVYYRKWVEDEGEVHGETMSAEHGNRYHLLLKNSGDFRRLGPLFAQASADSEEIPGLIHGLLERGVLRAALVVQEDRYQLDRYGRRTVTYLDQERSESFTTDFGGNRPLVAALWTLSLRRFYDAGLKAAPIGPGRAFLVTWAGETAAALRSFAASSARASMGVGIVAEILATTVAIFAALWAYAAALPLFMSGPMLALSVLIGCVMTLALGKALTAASPFLGSFVERLWRRLATPLATVGIGTVYASAAGLVRAFREAAAIKFTTPGSWEIWKSQALAAGRLLAVVGVLATALAALAVWIAISIAYGPQILLAGLLGGGLITLADGT